MKFNPPKGTRDIIGEDAVKFQKLIDVIRQVYEKYGFEPWFTPAFESFELLAAKGGLGEAVKDEIYYFEDKSGRPLGLRFDLTMPLARIVASNPQIPKPIKRYVIGPVWRYDNPQAMRWREFWQADIDIIGSRSTVADAECLAAICDILDQLGFEDYAIRVNNRKTLEDLLNFIPKDKFVQVLRIIDKLDKIGRDGVKEQLEKLDVNAGEILKIFGKEEEETLKMIEGKKGAEEIIKLYEYAGEYGFINRLRLDLSLVRGLDYYTSLVFEVNLGTKVSCGGGGRYDNLIKTIGGQDLPATGISLGLNRIFEVMKNKGMFKKEPKSKVFVAIVNRNLEGDAIGICKAIRKKGVGCEIDITGKKLSQQLEYADRMNIPYVIIVGEKELLEGKYKLKNMETGKEDLLTLEEILKVIE